MQSNTRADGVLAHGDRHAIEGFDVCRESADNKGVRAEAGERQCVTQAVRAGAGERQCVTQAGALFSPASRTSTQSAHASAGPHTPHQQLGAAKAEREHLLGRGLGQLSECVPTAARHRVSWADGSLQARASLSFWKTAWPERCRMCSCARCARIMLSTWF